MPIYICCCLGYRRLCSSNLRTRGRWRWIFHRLCEKIAEAVKYGQDFLTIEALSQWQRHTLLSSIFIAGSDPLPEIPRLATLLWKEKVQSGQKARIKITGVLQQTLRALELSGKPVRVASAAGNFTQEDFDRVEPLPEILGCHLRSVSCMSRRC